MPDVVQVYEEVILDVQGNPKGIIGELYHDGEVQIRMSTVDSQGHKSRLHAMTPATHAIDEVELTTRLRAMAAAGDSLGAMVDLIRTRFPGPDIEFATVLYLRRAFHLTVGEARLIEGSALLGRTLYDGDQTEALLRPLIERNRGSWGPAGGISVNNGGRSPNY